MGKILFLFPLVFPAAFGAYLLFTPMVRLIENVSWMGLPMPKEGSSAYTALRLFWRGIGVAAWLFVFVVAYLVIFRRN